MSTNCPWCSSQTESSLDHHDIHWYVIAILIDNSANKRCHSQNCSGKYRHIEEVHDVDSREDNEAQNHNKQSLKETEIAGPLLPEQQYDETGDIHLYTRVQILIVTFRVNQRATSNRSSTRQIIVGDRDLEDRNCPAQRLAEYLRLSREEYRAAISGYNTQPILSVLENRTGSGNISITAARSFRQNFRGRRRRTHYGEQTWYCPECHDGPLPSWETFCQECGHRTRYYRLMTEVRW